MELRALLFTADGSSAATLCQILTELGIQAEICSEVLVAAERISREAYDAIVVDWDQQMEAGSLLKKAREQRVPSLNLALVPDDARSAGRCNRAQIRSSRSPSRWPTPATR